MRILYFLGLIVSLIGLGLFDWRHSLALFAQTVPSLLTILLGTIFLLLSDIVGVMLNIFHTNPRYVSGIHLGHPDLPIEELLLLLLISYLTLLSYLLIKRKRSL